MIKNLVLTFASFIFLSLSSIAQQQEHFLEFTVNAEKEYEAISLNLSVEVSSENKDIAKAIKECNQTLLEVKEQLAKELNENDVEINIKSLNSFPETSFFSDYYKVTSRAEIKIKNKMLSEKVFAIIKKNEKATISDVYFKYKEDNEIENELILLAGKLAEEKISIFKKAFNKEYELTAIISNEDYLRYNSNRAGIREIVALNAGLYVNDIGFSVDSDKKQPLITSYPTKKFQYTVRLKYKIIVK